MSTGKIKWFMISSLAGNGILLSGGIVTNCVLKGCSASGIFSNNGTASVINCNIINNGTIGINADPGCSSLYIVNCISWSNGSTGFDGYYTNLISLSYSDGSGFKQSAIKVV